MKKPVGFWTRTGFMTTNFDEMVLWCSILRERGLMFAMTPRTGMDGETYWIFAVNANSLIAEDLINEEDFHDEFPIIGGLGGIFG